MVTRRKEPIALRHERPLACIHNTSAVKPCKSQFKLSRGSINVLSFDGYLIKLLVYDYIDNIFVV
jgi:hypothetical protein